jgi:hypothetical protein
MTPTRVQIMRGPSLKIKEGIQVFVCVCVCMVYIKVCGVCVFVCIVYI